MPPKPPTPMNVLSFDDLSRDGPSVFSDEEKQQVLQAYFDGSRFMGVKPQPTDMLTLANWAETTRLQFGALCMVLQGKAMLSVQNDEIAFIFPGGVGAEDAQACD